MNPFTLQYHPDYFCDRVVEIEALRTNLINGINTVVYSPRRIGKTAMILHLFHQLEESGKYETIYVDLFASRNLHDLVNKMGEQLLKRYHKKNLLEGVKKIFKGMYASISFSPDGSPQLSLGMGQGQMDATLENLFTFLEKRKKPVFIAFDEFQEIAAYPEKAEANLRSIIQRLNNVGCIFSGSAMHLLQNMFFSPSQAFYQSAGSLVLQKINEDVYLDFIIQQFKNANKEITNEAAQQLLEFTENHTFYTQMICNIAFYKTTNQLDIEMVKEIEKDYLESRKFDYYNIYNLLSENQKKIVIAIAKEGKISKPTAIDFLMKHKLPSASSTLQAFNSLVEKEIVYKNQGEFSVYDIFLKRFLQAYL